MFKNYLRTALRNFGHNKAFSAINIMGLAIGITSALVIFMIVWYEFGFDTFQKDRERIHRVVINAKFNGAEGYSAGVPAPLALAMKNEITGIEATVPVMYFQGDTKVPVKLVSNSGAETIIKKQSGVVFTNTDYFGLLGYKWLQGTGSAMDKAFNVVITRSRARQYFGDAPLEDIIGKTITYNEDLAVTVGGVVDDLNQQTIFSAGDFISYPTIAKTRFQENFMMNVWNDWMAYSMLYVKLEKGNTVEKTENALKGILAKYNKDVNRDAANTMAFKLQPLADVHFNGKYQAVEQRTGHKPTMYGLLAIGGFLLLLGCINFINLTTAQSAKRAKEIGIRKTMGSLRQQLVFQFLSETFILTIMASVLAIVLVPVLLKMFADFIPPGLEFSFVNQPGIVVFFALLIVVVTILSGIYPALVLSGFKPVAVLKNQVVAGTSSSRSAWLRKSLTVSQFLVAQFFVIATLMVGKQIRHTLNADLGFNKDAVINFVTPRDTVQSHGRRLLSEIQSLPGVEMVSTGFFAPADKGAAFINVTALVDGKEISPNTNVQLRFGAPEYLDVYKIKLVAGRNVEPSDTLREVLINESFARAVGFKDPARAINQSIKWNNRIRPIVGVMKDFHDMNMHAAVSPIIFGGQKGDFYHIRLRTAGKEAGNWQTTISAIGKSFKSVYPEEEFNYSFLDDTIAKFYQTEMNTAKLLTWATGLAIFISCLGLAGLVIYTTTNRKKEIGIRKVLGASISQIITILSKDFLKLVAIAFVIAVPLAWWAVSTWLDSFVYRTEMSWWVFAAGGVGMLTVALITVSLQTFRAATSNPAESLRTE